jgi:YesN/AraC family two-component response regulator
MNPQNVLLVDDEADIREGIVLLNEVETRVFTEASNGLEALELLKKSPFHIVISDITMPKMKGTELLIETRKMGIEIPFVFISGHSESNIIDQIKDQTNWYIVEKTDIIKISDIIQDILCHKKAA